MVGSYLRFFAPLFLVLYVSAFTIVAPLTADVDAFNNVVGNWTWTEGDPTKIIVHLFVNSQPDVCVFGKANPVDTRGIQGDIQRANEVNGQRNGRVVYQADKIGEYILCAYRDFTKDGTLNLSSIANSSVFSVSRLPIVQTTTVLGPSSSPEPTPSTSASNESTGPGSPSSPSGGVIAGAVVGGLSWPTDDYGIDEE
ncbi:hypothetical protein VNI00_018169 [Paramarasmius palmivorus]|uniref:Uncharacterized protein n=1 Tax=Paramarasmius palmivorus TaxID=297713 RepID=A0AAW0AZY4_9AGAR